MYDDEIVTISRSENGYFLTVRIPRKKTEDDPYPGSERKTYQFQDRDTMLNVLRKSLPAADQSDPEKEMAQAFKEAVKNGE